MKKVLILNYEYPPLGGGAGVVSQKYAEGLSLLGCHVTVVTTWFEGEKEYDKKDNLTIIKLKSLRKKTFQSNPIEMLSWVFVTIKFLNKYLKENSFDICIAFFSIPGGIVAKYLKEKFNLPYIISTHGHDIPGFFPEQMKKFHILTNWYTKKIWNQADKILVLTTDMKKLADSFGDEKKNILLPNGCNGDFFYPDITKKNKIFTLLFVGRFVDQKDPFTLLEAVRNLKKTTNNFIVNMVGNGPLKDDIETYIKKNNLQENIFLTGWLTKEQLRAYYQSSHIQICSSKVEAMSVAILESLYSGLYILSTPISGNTDIIKPDVTGEFFDIGDSNELTNKLKYWSNNFQKLVYHEDEVSHLKEYYNRDNIIHKLNEFI